MIILFSSTVFAALQLGTVSQLNAVSDFFDLRLKDFFSEKWDLVLPVISFFVSPQALPKDEF